MPFRCWALKASIFCTPRVDEVLLNKVRARLVTVRAALAMEAMAQSGSPATYVGPPRQTVDHGGEESN